MGKVVLYMQMSLDGVVGDVDQWAIISDEIMNQSNKRYDDIAISIYGGNTYPGMAEYWQDAEKNSSDPLEKAFAKKINDKVVVRVFNQGGQQVAQSSLSNPVGQVLLPVGSVVKGIYIVSVTDGRGMQVSGQVIL